MMANQNDEQNLPQVHESMTPDTVVDDDLSNVGTALVRLVDRIGPDATTEMVAALEKMCDLKIKMDAIQAQKNFAAAKARMQAELGSVPAIGEMKEGGFVKYRFPPLDKIAEVVKPICERHGFSYSFEYDIKPIESRLMVTTTFILLHKDGHSERTNFVCEMSEGNKLMREGYQKSGATQTGSMRRAMIGGLGLTWCDPDTDGVEPEVREKLNESEVKQLKRLIKDIAMDDNSTARFDRWIKGRFQAETIEDLPRSAFDEVMNQLRQKKAELDKKAQNEK